MIKNIAIQIYAFILIKIGWVIQKLPVHEMYILFTKLIRNFLAKCK